MVSDTRKLVLVLKTMSSKRKRSPSRSSSRSSSVSHYTPTRSSLEDEVSELKALVQTLVSAKRRSNANGHQYLGKSNLIPEFYPEKNDITAKRWTDLIEQIAVINSWDDRTTVFNMQSKLAGLAKDWFSTIVDIDMTWAQWKIRLIRAFPEGQDYDTVNRQMIERVKRSDETMTQYFYGKCQLLRKLEITGKNAVSCVIGGLQNDNHKAGARAGHYNTPEQLFSEYLAHVEDTRPTKVSQKKRATRRSQK